MAKKVKPILIKVEADHIKNGDKQNPYSCAIALAVKPLINETYAVYDDQVVDEYRSTIAFLPRSAQRFIKRFDNGKPVEPINFRLKFV